MYFVMAHDLHVALQPYLAILSPKREGGPGPRERLDTFLSDWRAQAWGGRMGRAYSVIGGFLGQPSTSLRSANRSWNEPYNRNNELPCCQNALRSGFPPLLTPPRKGPQGAGEYVGAS